MSSVQYLIVLWDSPVTSYSGVKRRYIEINLEIETPLQEGPFVTMAAADAVDSCRLMVEPAYCLYQFVVCK